MGDYGSIDVRSKVNLTASQNPSQTQSDGIFRDLSSRSQVFRDRLVSEFQLYEGHGSLEMQIPMMSSEEFTDFKARTKALLEAPFQLIKFKPFKRTHHTAGGEQDERKKDRRLTRTKNQSTLPIGAWAASVYSNVVYQRFLLALIILNSITISVEVELAPVEADYWILFQFLQVFNLFAVCIFVIDIVLKLIDDLKGGCLI